MAGSVGSRNVRKTFALLVALLASYWTFNFVMWPKDGYYWAHKLWVGQLCISALGWLAFTLLYPRKASGSGFAMLGWAVTIGWGLVVVAWALQWLP